MNYPIKKGYSMASNGFQDKSKQIEAVRWKALSSMRQRASKGNFPTKERLVDTHIDEPFTSNPNNRRKRPSPSVRYKSNSRSQSNQADASSPSETPSATDSSSRYSQEKPSAAP